MATKIQVRRDTAANWTSNDPTLSQGEIGFETDTSKFKIGDGSSIWTALAYQGTDVDLSSYVTYAVINNRIIKGSADALSITGGAYTLIRVSLPIPDVASPVPSPIKLCISTVGDESEVPIHFEAVFGRAGDDGSAAVISDQLEVYAVNPYMQTSSEEAYLELYVADNGTIDNTIYVSAESVTQDTSYSLDTMTATGQSATDTPLGNRLQVISLIDGGGA